VSVFAALPDGSYWSGHWSTSRGMNDAELRLYAAGSVSGTREEMREIEWPLRAVHGDEAGTIYLHGEEPVEVLEGVAS
jgi:hypothetical protein